MKFKRIAAFGLVCAMLLTPAMGAETKGKTGRSKNQLLWEKETEIAESVTLTESVFDNGARQNEHYISYTPNRTVQPLVTFGDTLRQRTTLPEIEASEEGGRRVLAAVNGDYFVMATGTPVGLVMRNGDLASSDGGNYAIGFRSDGSAIYGKPGLKLNFSIGKEEYRIQYINKDFVSGAFCLYTRDWGTETGVKQETWNAVLEPNHWRDVGLSGDTVYTVVKCYRSDGSVPIPEGCSVLCLSADSDSWRLDGLKSLEPDDQLTLEPELKDERFADCTDAMGSLYPLILNGRVVDDLDEIDRTKAPRTAVGIREDGTVLFYTVDGRQSGYSEGLTLEETALRLLELGCVDGGTLDGGASTAIGAQTPGTEECAIRNQPSGGSLRPVPTYLMLTAKAKGSRKLKTLSIYSEAQALLCGTEIQLTAGGCDECGYPVKIKEPEWDCDGGDITEDGLFTAPRRQDTVEVTVDSGNVRGSLTIPVVDSPDTFLIMNEKNRQEVTSLTMRAGEEISLCAEAYWEGLQLWLTDEQFEWSVSDGVGEITEDGVFTAGGDGGLGLIRVAAGKKSRQIIVTVRGEVTCADAFESVEFGSGGGFAWSGESQRDHVKFGFGSMKLEYDLSSGGASLSMTEYPAEGVNYGSLWVWTDGSGNRLYARYANEVILLDEMRQKGWKRMTLEPAAYGRLESLELRGEGSGTLWLDQFLLSDSEPDTDAPILSLEIDGTEVSGRVTDLGEREFSAQRIQLTLDGEALPFTYNSASGLLTASLNDIPAEPRRLALTATDRCGNRNRVSILLPGAGSAFFSDMTGHWAESYVDHLAAQGVVNGWDDGQGGTVFDPDSPITRAEFAVMLCRWLKLDTESDTQATEQFADSADIPDWARPGVAAAVNEGLIQGAAAIDGLFFFPQQSLTRAQAAVILGRTMPGGSMGSDLPFDDADAIPDWAASYVSQLAFLGVMRGDGVSFRPNGALTRAQAAKLLSELN